MDTFSKLVDYFTRFPGIGPRQAKRFVYFLLSQDKASLQKFAEYIKELKDDVIQCTECMRYFESTSQTQNALCNICTQAKEPSSLLIVEKDQDLESIHKTGAYNGKYFVIGGLLPILEKEPDKKIRLQELLSYINKKDFDEVIIALSVSLEGDYTAEYLKKTLGKKTGKKITVFGRGLSTGTELEYSDTDTIKNALRNRA